MSNRWFLNILCFFIPFVMFFSSCRTASIRESWGLCGYEDPVNECEWMQKIIRQNKNRNFRIAEVMAEKYIRIEETDTIRYEKTDEVLYAYQICFDDVLPPFDIYDMHTYDCSGECLCSGTNIGQPITFFDKERQLVFKCIVKHTNIIYI